MRAAFNKICKDANVHQGTGPPTAYFQTAPNGEGAIMRCIYESFGMDGPHDEGELVPGDKDFEEVLRSSIETFKQWLKPNCTLVWRHRPEVRLVGTYWSVYYRCVQLDDDARKLAIDWQF